MRNKLRRQGNGHKKKQAHKKDLNVKKEETTTDDVKDPRSPEETPH